ncbi:phage protease [Vibrio jasicida]|uniref:phage protease n=1 Tax=Vibrio jasicida TaxID=766224 RepID=UPI002157D6C9|nr:phage protease [Vibrio jasicida]
MPKSLSQRRPRQHPAMFENEQNANLAMNFYYGLTERSMPAAQTATAPEEENVKPIPEWLMLIPAGIVQGLDGRTWQNSNPQAVIDAFVTDGLDLPWDVEHSTHIKGPQGEYAGATGWIVELEDRDGEIWARIDWNDRGRWIIEDKDYKYYSPAFLYDDNGVITKIRSCGFTNDPNLADLPALNRKEGSDMPIPKAIATALGVTENADENSAVAAINTMKLAMNNRQDTVDLAKYVPRADYQLALNRAETAERTLSERDGAEAQALVDKAIEAGKVAPSSRDMYLATCRTQEGREQFQQFVASAQSISTQQTPPPAGGQEGTLSDDELAMCRQLNLSEDDFKKSKESLALK